jgi:nucleoside diphosphate-linked moiety X motif protein 19
MLAVRQTAVNNERLHRRVEDMQSVKETVSAELIEKDYKLLMLRRNAESSFFPASLVFPGGVSSHSDKSCHWKPLFERVTGETMSDLSKHFAVENKDRPHMISNASNEKNDIISADIAFRICAIRETFEECGILLVTGRPAVHQSCPYDIDAKIKAEWQYCVSQNAGEFLTLCHRLSVVPNIWALHEWSNWLTPAMSKVKGPSAKPKRYDTLFYLCCANCERLPEVTIDNKEIIEHQVTINICSFPLILASFILKTRLF